MTRLRWLPPTLVVGGALGLAPLPVAGADTEPRPFGVVDLHVDLSYQVGYRGKSFTAGSGQFAAVDAKRGGIAGVVLPLYIPRDVSPSGPRAVDLERSYAMMYAHLARSFDYALPGCIGAPGRARTWFAFEGAAPLAEDPSKVREWVARGVRVFGLVHSYDNALATSATGASKRPAIGLTDAGREVVRRVHAAGGIVDVSHASDRATAEVIELAKSAGRPAVATHSNARAIADHPRNLTDEHLRGIAETGGVVGLNFHSAFVTRRRRVATMADVVKQARHLVKVAGIDHVAIGSDFEGDIRPPVALPNASRFPALADALLADGMSRSDVSKIFGRNALRVLCAAPLAH